EDGIRDRNVTGVQTCALPISDFKNPDNVDYDTLDAATKASFYLCYDVVIPADELSELENDAVLRNTIRAYMDDELMGSSYTDYEIGRASCREREKNEERERVE